MHTTCSGHGPPPCRGPFEGCPSCLPRTDRQSLRVRIPVSQSLSSLTPWVLALKPQRTKREARADCLLVRLCSQQQPTTACCPSSWAASHRRRRQGQMQCSSDVRRAAGVEHEQLGTGVRRRRRAARCLPNLTAVLDVTTLPSADVLVLEPCCRTQAHAYFVGLCHTVQTQCSTVAV